MPNTTRPITAPVRKARRQPTSGANHARIEQRDRHERAERRADPEAAVDHQVEPSAIAGGDQFLDGRVDRGIFPADSRAGQKAEDEERRPVPRRAGQRRGGQVDGDGHEEQLLAAQPVGQPAEDQGAEDRAGEVGAGGEADPGIGKAQRRARLQRPGDRPCERHLEPVENPGDAERRHDEDMEAPPRQPLEPGRNERLDDCGLRGARSVRRRRAALVAGDGSGALRHRRLRRVDRGAAAFRGPLRQRGGPSPVPGERRPCVRTFFANYLDRSTQCDLRRAGFDTVRPYRRTESRETDDPPCGRFNAAVQNDGHVFLQAQHRAFGRPDRRVRGPCRLGAPRRLCARPWDRR